MWEHKGTSTEEWVNFLHQRDELERFIHERIVLNSQDNEVNEYVMIKYADPKDILKLLSDDVALFREVNRESMKDKEILTHYVFPGLIPPTKGMNPHIYKLKNQISAYNSRIFSEIRKKASVERYRYSLTNESDPHKEETKSVFARISSILPRLTSVFF